MPQSKTDQAERDTLDYLLRTRDAQMYLVLLTADPGESGAPSEPPTANGYARMPVHFAAAVTNSGTTTATNDGTNGGGGAGNGATVTFGPVTTANWTLWGIGIARSGTRGTNDLVYKEALTGQPVTIGVGSSAFVNPGDLVAEEQ